jgi:hypothetical protein
MLLETFGGGIVESGGGKWAPDGASATGCRSVLGIRCRLISLRPAFNGKLTDRDPDSGTPAVMVSSAGMGKLGDCAGANDWETGTALPVSPDKSKSLFQGPNCGPVDGGADNID